MQVYWLNGALCLYPDSKDEVKALETVTRNVKVIHFRDKVHRYASTDKKVGKGNNQKFVVSADELSKVNS